MDVTENQNVVERIEAELKAWPRAALSEVERLGELVRTNDDAQAVLRMAYTAVFMAVPKAAWSEWDELSEIIARGWDDARVAPEMIALTKLVGNKVNALCDRVNKLPPGSIGRFSMGLLALGVLGFGLTRRAGELAEQHVKGAVANRGC